MKRLRFLSIVGVVVAALTPSVAAQSCFGPDNLDGPCCDLRNVNLPPFPDMSMDGSGLTWDTCNPLPKQPLMLNFGAPVMVTCGTYEADFVAATGVGVFASGILDLVYSRTWDEVDPAGNLVQVWRFLVIAELDTSPPVPWLPSDNPSFYYGYVDYARACQSPGPLPAWQSSIVLFHNCDAFLHAPVWSTMPGVFDPTRTHAFVGPDSALQPFDHTGIVPPPSGTPASGAIRNFGDPAAAVCHTRERVPQASVQVLVQGCTCPFAVTLPPRNAATRIDALFGSCGGGFASLDVTAGGTFPWLHMISMSLGRWTNPAVYPGTEAPLAYEGPVIWRDACLAQNFVELHYGGGTRGGWDRLIVTPAGTPLQSMLGTRSNWSIPLPGPISLPIVGAIFPSPVMRHTMYFDLP